MNKSFPNLQCCTNLSTLPFFLLVSIVLAAESSTDGLALPEGHQDECAICLVEFLSGDKRADQINARKFVWECSHPHNLQLHKACMKKHMEIAHECPICRTPLKDVRPFKRFRKKSERQIAADAVEAERREEAREAERRRQRQERAASRQDYMDAMQQYGGMMAGPFGAMGGFH